MNRINARWLSLLAFTVICLYLCWLIVAPFVDVILWSAMLAIISYPNYLRWRSRKWGPAMAALFTALFVVLLVIVPLGLVVAMLAGQVDDATELVQKGMQLITDPNSKLHGYLSRWFDVGATLNPQAIAEKAKAVGAAIAARSVGLVGGLLGAVVQIFFVLFTLYYLLKDADRIVPALRNALPLEKEQADEVFGRAHDVIFASVRGVLVIAAIQGALGGIAFWVLGLKSPMLWGVVMFLLSMVPMLGAFLVWGPAAVFLFATGDHAKAIILVVWGGVLIGSVDNFLRPKLVGERTRLHELVIFFSVLGGLQVFGILGLFVGPVVVAITLSLIDIYKQIGSKFSLPTQQARQVEAVTIPVENVKKD